MMLKSRQNATFFIVILLFSLGIRLYWAFIIPPWQGPDEPTHYEYVHYFYQKFNYADTERWDQSKIQYIIIQSMEKHDTWLYMDDFTFYEFDHFLNHYSQIDNSPPLFYSLNGLFLRFFSPASVEKGLFHSRLFNILLGAGQIIVLILFSRRYLFQDDPSAWPYYMLSIVFLPQYAFINSVVNSDNLAYLIHFLFLWAVFSYYRSPDWKKLGLMLILSLAGIITKRYLYFMGFFIPVTLIIKHGTRGARLIWLKWLALTFVLLAVFVYIFLSPIIHREIREFTFILSYFQEDIIFWIRNFIQSIEILFNTYFFRAGWMNIYFPRAIYWILLFFVIISFVWFCRFYKEKNKPLILMFTFFYLLLIFFSDFLHPHRNPQGRYLFTILPIFNYVLFQGIISRYPEIRQRYFSIITAAWIVFFLSSSVFIWYHYYFKYMFIQ